VPSFYHPSFLALSFPKRSHYEVLESIIGSLLILVCDVFCEQYETVLNVICSFLGNSPVAEF